MASIISFPGGYHGAWYFSPIMPRLRNAGHDAHALTLTGLGGPPGRHWPAINLDTHIEDVVSYIESEKLTDVVLCCHSDAGLVIAGAAGRLPGRIRTLLFIDALVPRDSESGWSTLGARTTRCVRSQLARRDRDEPAPGVDCRARPHPLACFLQPVRLGDHAYQVDEKVFVSCRAWADGPYEAIHERVVAEGDWTIHRIPFGHDIMNEAPDVTLELLLATSERRPFSLSS